MCTLVRGKTNVKANANINISQKGVTFKNNAPFGSKRGSTFSTNSCLFQQKNILLPSLVDVFSNNSEVLSKTDKISCKLHEKLTHISKNVNIKKREKL